MNTVIIKEENIEEFQWMSAVVEETVSTSNGEKSQVLSKSQKGEFSKNNTHIPFGSCIDSESGKKKIASKKKRKDKKAKDRVKKPLNAFMLYFKEKRAELVANSTIYKNSPFELSKVVGKLWHSLTDEQRAAYYAQACEERRRHALLHPWKGPSQPRPRKRRPSGFFRKCRAKYGMDSQHLWCANCRRKKKCLWLLKALAEENGGVLPKLPPRRKKPSKDLSEKNDSSLTISKAEFQWMPAVVEETVSTSNGEKSQVLPKSQKGEFSKNNTHISSGSCIDSESGKKKIASKKKRKEKKAKDRVKKPLNAFMLYLKEKRAELVANSTIYKNSSSELNKVVGKLWHSLTDEQRAAYYAQACEERRRHALLHPWKGPSQPRPRKRRPSGFFRKCRAKYGMDSQHLWCANCRRKKKCLWLLKALAEENGGVLPKLPPRHKKPSKDSSEKNDWFLAISKAGKSRYSVLRIKNSSQNSTPKKNKPKSKKKIDLDDFDLCAIRHKIHEFYAVKREIPTIRKLLHELKDSINFPGGRESLRLILHKIGFKYKKCRNQRQVLQERFDIVAWRERYLDEIQSIRGQNMPIVYLDESYIHTKLNQNMCWSSEYEPGIFKSVAQGQRYVIVHAGGSTGFVPNALLIYNDKEKKSDFHEAMNRENFKKWVLEKLIPNVNVPTCIVMDNAKYHSVQINKAPNSNYRKQEIMDWLTNNNIPFNENCTKSNLLVLVQRNKPEPVYEIDKILSEKGHKVLRLPPYHCDLNPIEMVWGIVKGKVASKNINLSNIDFLQLVSDCFQEVTPEVWANCCKHVEQIENNFRNSSPIIEKEIDKLIIHVGDNSSTSDDQSSISSTSNDEIEEESEFEDIQYLESDFDYED